MTTRTMQVTERNETLKQTFFELRQDNGTSGHDDRFTVVFDIHKAPGWKCGDVVSVTVEVK
jgi:hypothetical protein